MMSILCSAADAVSSGNWFTVIIIIICYNLIVRPSFFFNNGFGARGVMVIVAGYGHGDTSSNPGPD